jgi:hypothetical protein
MFIRVKMFVTKSKIFYGGIKDKEDSLMYNANICFGVGQKVMKPIISV